MRRLLIALPSPLPFRKLGVPELKLWLRPSLEDLDLRAVRGGFSVPNGLGGTFPLPPLGGCGKELILTVFRTVLGVIGFSCVEVDFGS
jgi:hypothetical protein